MQGTCSGIASKVLSILVSSTQKLPRLSLVFCVTIFFCFGTLCHIITVLVIIKTSDMTQVFPSRASNIAGIDTGSWDEVFPGFFVI